MLQNAVVALTSSEGEIILFHVLVNSTLLPEHPYDWLLKERRRKNGHGLKMRDDSMPGGHIMAGSSP